MFKTCALLSLCAGVCLGQPQFVTGQAARLVIGQTSFTAQTSGASDTLLGAVGGLAFGADTLFVADSNVLGFTPSNSRVLLFQHVSEAMPSPTAQIPAYSGICPVCVGQANLVLGQPDFLGFNFHTTQAGMREATAVATDGRVVAVADTGNNRVLLWLSMPTSNGQPADVVLGQTTFNFVAPIVATASSFRGPEGVWIQNGKLFVADTGNNRILIWNSIPTTNNQPADVELGQSNFTSVSAVPATCAPPPAPAPFPPCALLPGTQGTMLDPDSVTSDGVRLFVADTGYNRVLIWNSIPTQNGKPSDVEIGQPNFVSTLANDVADLCPAVSPGVYPAECGRTLNEPSFVLSNGTQLFVADGNDRVLIFNQIPTQNAAEADVVLGQPDEFASVVTSVTSLFYPLLLQSGAAVDPTPTSLAWDGTNLYVADPSNRRVLVYTPAAPNVPNDGIRNAASLETFATDEVDVSGTIEAGDTITITINTTNYTYTILSTDTQNTIVTALVNLINAGAGDPNVYASVPPTLEQLLLTSRVPGPAGNGITVTATTSLNAMISVLSAGSNLTGGESAGTLAPGTLATIFGTNLAAPSSLLPTSNCTASPSSPLPIDLCGVEVYFDGIRSPLILVSPTQINTQIPWELSITNNINAYVRTVNPDGSVTVTNAVAIPLDTANPGIFAQPGPDPRVALAYHNSSYATATITLAGTIAAGDVGTITVAGRTYSYTVQSSDSLTSIRDAFIAIIDADPDRAVTALAGAAFTRILLQAKIEGPEGDGIPLFATSVSSTGGAGSLALDGNNTVLCCSSKTGAPITMDDPALPGEQFYIYGTGLGLVFDINGNLIGPLDGTPYPGPVLNNATVSVSSIADAKSADVISASLVVGTVGFYQIVLQLNPDIQPSNFAELTISQNIYTSNIVTIAVGNPTTPPICCCQ
jgi:uncharacterized protein (TIGR03437 family)